MNADGLAAKLGVPSPRGVAAVEAALPGGLSFGEVLADRAVANVLSDE